MQPTPRAGRLLAIIDALTELTSVATDLQTLSDTIVRNVARLDGATGAAVRVSSRNRDIIALADPSLGHVDVRGLFPMLFGEKGTEEFKCVDDTGTCDECDAVIARTLNVRSVIAAPLRHGNGRIGTLWVYSSGSDAFHEEECSLVERFARIVGAVLELSLQFHEKLQESRTDDLTGLQNRRAYDENLRHALAESQRYRTALSLIIADLDDFKAINDRLGHVQGDAALIHVAAVMQKEVRGTDSVFRVGGDEFAIIMPQSGGDAAKKVMARITRRLRSGRNLAFGKISLSYGVADATAVDDALALHNRADLALYANKNARTA